MKCQKQSWMQLNGVKKRVELDAVGRCRAEGKAGSS